ncbi:MAG: ribosomal protein S18-alanine N-acetyltransferase [Clostridia bacterium]|nr:ribosomal protein S18-alanine N-acetyltransferase [Clostridia bacterium]
MEIEIRRATSADLSAVSSLWQRCYSIPWSDAAIENEINDASSVFLVAMAGGALVGYALMKCAVGEGELCNIAVEPEQRRLGAGRALVSELLRVAKSLGLDVVMLEVRASNDAAISLYENAGFERVGMRKNYYRAPREDAYLYNYYL